MQLLRTFLTVLALLIGIASVVYIFWDGLSRIPETPTAEDQASTFTGSFALACDADMIGTAYADGILNQLAGLEDSLLVFTYQDGEQKQSASLAVSNSVISWPSILAWHPDHQLISVAETKGQVPSEVEQMTDVWEEFPEGQSLQMVQWDGAQLTSKQDIRPAGSNVQGPTWNSNRQVLAVASTEENKEIRLWKIDSTGMLQSAGSVGLSSLWPEAPAGSQVNALFFHPRKNLLVLNLNNTHLMLATLVRQLDRWNIKPVDSPVEVAICWSEGEWHPGGDFFVLTDVGWGEGSTGFVLNKKGHLVSVRCLENEAPVVVGKAKVGLSPEGMALSPDGQFAAAVNMRRSYLPKSLGFVPGRMFSSMSLVRIRETGELETLGKEYGFPGALPEDVLFDDESNSLAVVIFHEQDLTNPRKGKILFWELIEERLVRTPLEVSTARGGHALLPLR
ncbi:MAG: hypothetical protein AAGH79_15385 [Bacteroidota bacterium]